MSDLKLVEFFKLVAISLVFDLQLIIFIEKNIDLFLHLPIFAPIRQLGQLLILFMYLLSVFPVFLFIFSADLGSQLHDLVRLHILQHSLIVLLLSFFNFFSHFSHPVLNQEHVVGLSILMQALNLNSEFRCRYLSPLLTQGLS